MSNRSSVRDLNCDTRFGERGLGARNGQDGASDTRWLNSVDTLTFRPTGADGNSNDLAVVSFMRRRHE